MKKAIYLFVFMCTAYTSSAQLKVDANGKVGAVVSTIIPQAELSVGNYDGYSYSGYNFGLWARRLGNVSYNIGIRGYSTSSLGTGRTIGVQGIGGAGQSGRNYGVVGGLMSSSLNGAGVFGTTANHLGVLIPGLYAGYFDGDVYIKCLDRSISSNSF